eukprot:5039704-Pleurochrysis_carterae.AAC.2
MVGLLGSPSNCATKGSSFVALNDISLALQGHEAVRSALRTDSLLAAAYVSRFDGTRFLLEAYQSCVSLLVPRVCGAAQKLLQQQNWNGARIAHITVRWSMPQCSNCHSQLRVTAAEYQDTLYSSHNR